MITLPLLSWVFLGLILGGTLGIPSALCIPREGQVVVANHTNGQEAEK